MRDLQIFISHSHHDTEIAQFFAQQLKKYGITVWLDEEDLKAGDLGRTIEDELEKSKVFLLILSPYALSSRWVEKETRAFEELSMDDRTRILLPVTVEPLSDSVKMRPFLRTYKRIEKDGGVPYSRDEVLDKIVDALGLSRPAERDSNVSDFSVGDVVHNRYQVMKVIHEGPSTGVYQVKDQHIPGNVVRALKISRFSFPSSDYIRKSNEARILGILHHPMIPTIYDYLWLEDKYEWIVMDFITGSNLETIVQQTEGFLFANKVVEWMLQLCEIVSYLHNFNPAILVRSIWPRDIMLDAQNHIVLTDFDIAIEFNPNEIADKVGVQGYAAQELYEGRPDPRSDIYAIGATMHALLTKTDPRMRAPFTFHQHPIRVYNPTVSAALESIVMRCVQQQQADRYQSVNDLQAALSQLASPSGWVS
jgi:serine/threonine protein kinase